MLYLDLLGLASNWVGFLLVICDGRLSLAKRSKICCSIESRTYVHQADFYPKQAAAQPSIEEETRFLVERVSPRLLDAVFVS
ncbi:hypothetical protein QUA79_07020 [Microcoleus sp. F8-D1]